MLLVDNAVGFTNSSGLCIRVLADLQKVFGCKTVYRLSGSADSLHPEQKQTLKLQTTASHLYSSRINLAFRSNTVLKTGAGFRGFGQVLEFVLGKQGGEFSPQRRAHFIFELSSPTVC